MKSLRRKGSVAFAYDNVGGDAFSIGSSLFLGDEEGDKDTSTSLRCLNSFHQISLGEGILCP